MSYVRISNNMIYGQNMKRLSLLQAQLNKTQEHLSANTRLLTPEDDPVAAARALDLKQGLSMNTQFESNRGNAKDALTLQESTLSSMVGRIQDVQTLLVSAGNGGYTGEQFRVVAEEIRSIRDEMLGYANTRDAYGNYLFSGHMAGTESFHMAANGDISYQGDDGHMMVQTDAARYTAVTNSGADIFMGIKGITASQVKSTSNQLVAEVDITDETQLVPGTQYRVSFAGTTPAATYTVARDTPDNTTVPPTTITEYYDAATSGWVSVTPPATPPVAGDYTAREKEPISIVDRGVEIRITGPADGNATPPSEVLVTPGKPERSDVFAYLNNAINLLEHYADYSPEAANTNMALGLESLLTNFANTLDQVTTAQSSAGTRLKELDSLDLSGTDKNLQYTESISELEDLDYYEAISNLYMQQYTLEAAQKTFMMTNGLSLFSIM
ncbi:MAG: flagellar hook-associated protein FlgL [Burkholderiaceae bacterium]|jgi:flagellar hook-associated protein 3 FlgL|nr:flagellar hook-associated protein FlgL [Burkholderiaceae bacterium]